MPERSRRRAPGRSTPAPVRAERPVQFGPAIKGVARSVDGRASRREIVKGKFRARVNVLVRTEYGVAFPLGVRASAPNGPILEGAIGVARVVHKPHLRRSTARVANDVTIRTGGRAYIKRVRPVCIAVAAAPSTIFAFVDELSKVDAD
jgi:hypothetical protein